MKKSDKAVILLYNVFALFFLPSLLFWSGFWSVEAGVKHWRYGGGAVMSVIFIFVPEMAIRIKWDLDKTFDTRIFTVLCSIVVGIGIHKLLHYCYVVDAHSPKTYCATNVILAMGFIWTVVMEFHQTLCEYIREFPTQQWLLPNSEDETANRCWHGVWLLLLLIAAVIRRRVR